MTRKRTRRPAAAPIPAVIPLPGRHETVAIPLKTVEVDRGVAPVVRWLNAYPDVLTLYSCEGHDHADPEKHARPYVLFLCLDLTVLDAIVRKVHHMATVTVTNFRAQRRFSVEFADRAALRRFIDFWALPTEDRPQ